MKPTQTRRTEGRGQPRTPGTRQAMAAAVVATGLLSVAMLSGCGDRRLVLKVDVYSFLDSTETRSTYGPVPPGSQGVLGVVTSRRVNLLSGVEGIVEVESVELFARAVFDNRTGSGDAAVVAVFARSGGAPVDSVRFPVRLEPGRTDTLDASLAGSRALAQLFRESELELSLRLELNTDGPPAGVDPLEGDFRLTRLLTVLTARREVN